MSAGSAALFSRRTVVKAGLTLPLAGCVSRPKPAETRLELWTLALQPFASYIRGLIESFEANHPGVRVEWVDVPYDAMERKLVAATAARQSPDVVNMSDLTFARFASLGAFADLDRIEPTPARERYLPGAIGMCRIGGVLLSIPWYLTTQAVMANRTLLVRGGLDPDSLPHRWRDLLSLSGAFQERTGAFLFSHPLGHESQLPSILLAEGVRIFDTDDRGALKAELTSPAVHDVLEPWVKAFQSGWIPRESATQGHAHLVEGYQSGRLALINSGPNFLGRIKDVAPSVFEATAVRPAITGALGRAHISVMTLGVMSRSKHPDLAAALAWHLTSPEAQLEFCKIVNILPSTPASLSDPLFSAPSTDSGAAESRITGARALTARSLPDAVAFTPALAAWPDMRKAFEDQFVRVLLGTRELGEALDTIQSRWNRLLVATGGGTLDAVPMPPAIGEPR